MKKVLKWTGIVVGSLIGIVLIAVTALNVSANARMNKVYEVSPSAIDIPTDAASLERGEYLARYVSGCASCHGSDLAGIEFFSDPALGTVYSANLTGGQGSPVADYTTEDWVRAIRHGVGKDGRMLLIMPSTNYWAFSDEDLGAVIAFIQSQPAVDHETPAPNFSFIGKALVGANVFGQMPAEVIDHTAPYPSAPAEAANAAYGEYLSYIAGCRDCHGANLNGSPSPDPAGTYGPNLTPGGAVSFWSFDQFVETLRTGVNPDGKALSDEMPFDKISHWSDDELQAIWLYLQSLPAMEDGK